eukprot:CAMPEP_0113507394 /NCGR_PEP_ID=MMETSP0014_2-20120614/36439_1 /TAXON_ID=2857 /ORGANISM="Nitzschia sp." /LENGTH=116 /DNA_ID=CAMNT_0000402995 /DNA_START=44 /DNA_END=391 /DNA_ORIENTATION=+ /assembly_acc=CAM_ASM_000159
MTHSPVHQRTVTNPWTKWTSCITVSRTQLQPHQCRPMEAHAADMSVQQLFEVYAAITGSSNAHDSYEHITDEADDDDNINTEAPLEKGDHPECEQSPLLDPDMTSKYQSLKGSMQW